MLDAASHASIAGPDTRATTAQEPAENNLTASVPRPQKHHRHHGHQRHVQRRHAQHRSKEALARRARDSQLDVQLRRRRYVELEDVVVVCHAERLVTSACSACAALRVSRTVSWNTDACNRDMAVRPAPQYPHPGRLSVVSLPGPLPRMSTVLPAPAGSSSNAASWMTCGAVGDVMLRHDVALVYSMVGGASHESFHDRE